MDSTRRGNEKPSDITAETISSLGSTVDTFASRLRRKLRDQEIAEDLFEKESEKRRTAMMQAMLSIRKALQESARAELGKRFSLDLDMSDSDGWPRLELNLTDALLPEKIEHGLIVTATDRNSQGLILFVSRNRSEVISSLCLVNPEDIIKLPMLLKLTLRKFLDLITPFVLNPVSQKEIDDEKPMSLEESKVAKELMSQDVFSEDERHGCHNTVENEELVPLAAKL